ncbi:MAG: transglutaminase TgpA family protein [Streptosporangiaceae bacterium]
MSQRLTIAAATATIAASLSLYPLVSGWLWFWEGAGAVAVAALAGALTRLRVLPWVLCAVIGVAAQVLYLNLLLSSAHSAGRLIPTATSLHHLWRLAQLGLDGTARFAPPAPASPGILLLTAAGIGVVAVATDLLAVRLRRPAVAGLPLLVLFCVPLTASVHQGVFGAMTVFGLGMAGYLAMLAVDGRERLRLWGRLVTVWHRGQDPAVAQRGSPNTRELAAAGRRIGVAAVVIALFIPLMVPGLRNHKLFSGGGGGATLVALPNPLVQMNSELHQKVPVHVLTYRTTDPDPQYLQVYVLSNLTTNTWTLAPGTGEPVKDGKLPATPGLSRTTHASAETTRITLAKGLTTGPRQASFLPLPYPARSVSVDGDWRTDPRSLTMFSAQSLSGLSYTATSREVSPTERQLQQSGEMPNSIATNYLSVPKAFLPLGKLAERITHGQATFYGEAVALQRWFTETGKFTYSLNVDQNQPPTAQALINFLTKDRRGYCQQFAFAMAVLARLLDIPSRVAVGYTEGSPIGHDRWDVRTSDAHAWPELYFQGAGWLRFEPTPSGSEGQATAIQPAYTLPPQTAVPGGPQSAPSPAATVPGPGATQGDRGALAKLGHLSARGGAGGDSAGHSGPIWLIVIVAVVVLLITPRLVRSLTRRRRWSRAAGDGPRAQAAWLELLDDLTDHKIAWSASESPRTLGTRLTRTLRLSPEGAAALARIVQATERARYARDPAGSATLQADTDLVRSEVAANSGRAARWRARLVPPSSLRPVRAALQHAPDVFSWMDVAAHRTGAWSRRGPRHQPGGAD